MVAATQSGGRLLRVPDFVAISMTRRHVLAGAAGFALLLAGCTTDAPREAEPAPRDPLADLLDAHLALATTYATAIDTAPNDPRLPALAGNISTQIGALAGALAIPTPSATPTQSASSSASPGPGATIDPAAELAALRADEQALAEACRALTLSQSNDRAPLLGSLCAAHACAAEVLQ